MNMRSSFSRACPLSSLPARGCALKGVSAAFNGFPGLQWNPLRIKKVWIGYQGHATSCQFCQNIAARNDPCPCILSVASLPFTCTCWYKWPGVCSKGCQVSTMHHFHLFASCVHKHRYREVDSFVVLQLLCSTWILMTITCLKKKVTRLWVLFTTIIRNPLIHFAFITVSDTVQI